MADPLQCDLPPVLALAFLGDAVWSQLVRDKLVREGVGVGKLHDAALGYVSCEAQQAVYHGLREFLSPFEQDLCRRAFNNPHLRKPKHAKGDAYRAATALEALFGWLSFSGDRARMDELFARACGASDAPWAEGG